MALVKIALQYWKDAYIRLPKNPKIMSMSDEELKQWEFVFNVVAALGSLATIGGFVYLFLRNRDTENQIRHLETIAQNQNLISDTMQQELSEIKRQSDILKDNNETFNKQFELSLNVFSHQKLSDEQKALMDLQKEQAVAKRRLSDIMPEFIKGSGTSDSQRIEQALTNSHGRAVEISVEFVSGTLSVYAIPANTSREKGQTLNLSFHSSITTPIRHQMGKINLFMKDQDQNKYVQELTIRDGDVIVDRPKLVPPAMPAAPVPAPTVQQG